MIKKMRRIAIFVSLLASLCSSQMAFASTLVTELGKLAHTESNAEVRQITEGDCSDNNGKICHDIKIEIQESIPYHIEQNSSNYNEKSDNGVKPDSSTQWVVDSNKSLHSTLFLWSKKAKWNLVWNSDYDYKISAKANFYGDFVHSVSQLFSSMGQLSPPVYIRFYPKNSVLVVDAHPDS